MYSLKDLTVDDVAEVKRVKKGKIYKAGTIYLRVSACSKNKDIKVWNMLEQSGTIEDSCAYLVPRMDWIPDYLIEVLEMNAPRFMENYIGKNINISMDLFKFYKIQFHTDIKMQKHIADQVAPIKKAIKQEEKHIHLTKETKTYMLNNLFV